MNILIFGAGKNGTAVLSYFRKCRTKDNVIGFLDNSKQGCKDGVPIYRPSFLKETDFDEIIISHAKPAVAREMVEQLKSHGVPERKIKSLVFDTELQVEVFSNYINYSENDRRVQFLGDFAMFASLQNLTGSVAECGVNKGDFSYWINKCFPNEKLYLFDTFEGFDSRDIDAERSLGVESFLRSEFNSYEMFRTANVEIVRRKMPFSTNV